MYGNMFDGLITGLIVCGMVVGAAICGICFWLVPMLWHWAKPWLHMVTG